MFLKKLKEVQEFIAGDETLLKEILHPKNDPLDLSFSLAHCQVKAGTATIPHFLENSSEVYYILSGKGIIHIGEESSEIEAGDIILVPKRVVQYVTNTEKRALTFLVIVSPPWSKTEEVIIQKN